MDRLPVECICCILAFTSPKDVCKIAGVSTAFRSAADSDLLWRTFLPPDYRQIIAQSSSSPLFWFLNSLPEKALYFHLSDHPLLIGTGNSSITLEKESGSKCYMIGSRDIDATMRQPYWTWKFVLQSSSADFLESSMLGINISNVSFLLLYPLCLITTFQFFLQTSGFRSSILSPA
ncbi:unnamed protein product [Citrullus colocynthis]|uniref:F-box domain-containing protein n=1 Tax=Citrullus colocynthis TaxID=252529 RepID=A0ABP0YES4_9ROSI